MLRILVALVFLAAAAAPPAHAGNPGKGNAKGKGPPPSAGNPGKGDDDRDAWSGSRGGDGWHRFTDAERRWYRDYWRDQYAHGHCPPGLAKKRNGCLPPGQAKKRYAIGRPLPGDVAVLAVPPHVLGRLPPIEPGYRYGMVDGDLLKLAVGTSLVVDAMVGLLD